MQPNELLIRQHFIVIKSGCYSAADKARVDRAIVDKAITDGRATKEATAKKTTVAGAADKSVMESVGPDSTLALVVGPRRAATASDSTPPEKWFRCAWKQRYGVLF
jgi:hypothetical protein